MIPETDFAEGDPCPNCGKPMSFDPGYPDSLDEPGQASSVYCEDCGLSYPAGMRQSIGEADSAVKGWGLELSFWIDTEAYTDRDRAMFVAGFEFARIAAFLEHDENPCEMVICRENESRVRMAAGKFGRTVLITQCEAEVDPDGTWSRLTIERRSK